MRFRHIGILIALALLATAIVAAPASAGQPSVKQLKQQLRQAKHLSQRARQRARVAAVNLAGARELYDATNPGLTGSTPPDPGAATATPSAGMDPALAAALLADGVVTADEVAAVQARAAKRQTLARRWGHQVKRLQQRVRQIAQLEAWNRRGDWRPLIEIASRKYGVSAAGLYKLMMLESGGQRTVVSGPYQGLFQFMTREWSTSWNQWRAESIFDGWAQIRLAALAISRGMGPSIWTNTYRMAF